METDLDTWATDEQHLVVFDKSNSRTNRFLRDQYLRDVDVGM